jgi:hypothetical protein
LEGFTHGGPPDTVSVSADAASVYVIYRYHAMFRKMPVNALSSMLDVGFAGGPNG